MTIRTSNDFTQLEQQRVLRVIHALENDLNAEIHSLFNELHPADAAHIIQSISSETKRLKLLDILGKNFDPEILLFLAEHVREKIFAKWAHGHLAAALAGLDQEDLAELLNDLDQSERYALLPIIRDEMRGLMAQLLSYPPDTAGRIMRLQVVCLPESWLVHKARRFMSKANNIPDTVHVVYVISSANRSLIGKIDLLQLFRLDDTKTLRECCETLLYAVHTNTKVTQVMSMFKKYSLYSIPVLDEKSRLVGEILMDKALELVDDRAADELMHFHAGTDEFDFYHNTLETVKARAMPILLGALFSCISSLILNYYQYIIADAVVLATLLPLMPAVCATSGMQSVTMTVRALSTGALDPANCSRSLWKELRVSIYIGLLQGLLLACVILFLHKQLWLSMLVLASIVLTSICSSMFGFLIPILLTLVGHDPAMLSAALLANLTDWTGYVVFLSLAYYFCHIGSPV